MKNKNQYLLDCYQAAFGTVLPSALSEKILSGEFIKFSNKEFLEKKSNQVFEIELIKDIGNRMGGLIDQSIRLAIAEGLDTDEPIAFAELKSEFVKDSFTYNLVLFPTYDPEDPCAVYLLKHKGYPGEEFEDEDEDEDIFESDLEFEMEPAFDSLADLFSLPEKR
ncbi:hypothetical protein [Leptospira adleri]|uniref:Uncharacterized protein n=1 Tax=Leptospira adleri TaxID=2023186 RepID=A0A2M9YPQ9_9LEPT|nr:hypothetical protein [Leptospira adleri]PJZ53521.1 hypothetical protein CH380_10095 [Leptospira adleri]PJZ62226.1 hypothetical protein CH376_09135 [Leptospira adleri]